MNNIKITNVVFCENIRQEVGGKHTLLGASPSELNVSRLPAVILIAIWISGVPDAPGPFAAEFRVLDVDKQIMLNGKLEGEIAGTGESSLAIGPMSLQINKVGDYIFEWNFDGENWCKIGTLHMTNKDATATTTSAPIA